MSYSMPAGALLSLVLFFSTLCGQNSKAEEEGKRKGFQLLGLSAGGDTSINPTAALRVRYFRPLGENEALQIGAGYMRHSNRQEGQFDAGLIDRYKKVQVGMYAGFRRVQLKDYQFGATWGRTPAGASGQPSDGVDYRLSSGGTLGQAAVGMEYLFSRGSVGLHGTKAVLDSPQIFRFALSPSTSEETYLSVVDEVGGSTHIGLYKDVSVESDLSVLFRQTGSLRLSGTVRFIKPLNPRWALTLEAGLNETLVGRDNLGRVAVGLQFGSWIQPEASAALKHPAPMHVPFVHYEILTRAIQTGAGP